MKLRRKDANDDPGENHLQHALRTKNSARGMRTRSMMANARVTKIAHNRQYNCTHVTKYEQGFNANLAEARLHFQQCGTWLLTSIKNDSIRHWVSSQRRNRNKGKLCICRCDRLDAIGFEWSEDRNRVLEEHWEAMYEKLKAYKQEHGTCQISQNLSDDTELLSWAHQQNRVTRVREGIRPDRKAKLDLLGFYNKPANDIPFLEDADETISTIERLNKEDEEWAAMYGWLKAYEGEHGHCHVSTCRKRDTMKLRIWVKAQRCARLKDTRPDRAAKLDKLGFCWDVNEEVAYIASFNETRFRGRDKPPTFRGTKGEMEHSQGIKQIATTVKDGQEDERVAGELQDEDEPAVPVIRSKYDSQGNNTTPASQQEFEMINARRQRSLRCPGNRDDLNRHVEDLAFVSGSVAQKVIAKLQEKMEQERNSTKRRSLRL